MNQYGDEVRTSPRDLVSKPPTSACHPTWQRSWSLDWLSQALTGFGALFHSLIHFRMSSSRSVTLWWAERFHLLVGDLARCPELRLIRQRAHPARHESHQPLADGLPHHPGPGRDPDQRRRPSSSAQASTTRARSASDYDAVRFRDRASSDAHSASGRTSGTSLGLGTSRAL
jgi:hypothetical protein